MRAGSMTMKMDLPKTIAALTPAAVSLPAFASTDVRQLLFSLFPNIFQHEVLIRYLYLRFKF